MRHKMIRNPRVRIQPAWYPDWGRRFVFGSPFLARRLQSRCRPPGSPPCRAPPAAHSGRAGRMVEGAPFRLIYLPYSFFYMSPREKFKILTLRPWKGPVGLGGDPPVVG